MRCSFHRRLGDFEAEGRVFPSLALERGLALQSYPSPNAARASARVIIRVRGAMGEGAKPQPR